MPRDNSPGFHPGRPTFLQLSFRGFIHRNIKVQLTLPLIEVLTEVYRTAKVRAITRKVANTVHYSSHPPHQKGEQPQHCGHYPQRSRSVDPFAAFVAVVVTSVGTKTVITSVVVTSVGTKTVITSVVVTSAGAKICFIVVTSRT